MCSTAQLSDTCTSALTAGHANANALSSQHCTFLTSRNGRKARELISDLAAQYRLGRYDRLFAMRKPLGSGLRVPSRGHTARGQGNRGTAVRRRPHPSCFFCTDEPSRSASTWPRARGVRRARKFDGVEFKYLMVRAYNQMAGRAGRQRPWMKWVNVLLADRPRSHGPQGEIERIYSGKNGNHFKPVFRLVFHHPQPLQPTRRRRFRHVPQEPSQLPERPVRFYLVVPQGRGADQQTHRLSAVRRFLDKTNLTEKGKLAAAVNGYEIQAAELFYSRSFEECTPVQLPVLIGALITEESRSRKNRPCPTSGCVFMVKPSSISCGRRKCASTSTRPYASSTFPSEPLCIPGQTAVPFRNSSRSAFPKVTSSAFAH